MVVRHAQPGPLVHGVGGPLEVAVLPQLDGLELLELAEALSLAN